MWRLLGACAIATVSVYLFAFSRREKYAEVIRTGTAKWWPYGESSLRGWVRATSTGVLSFGFFCLAALTGDANEDVGSIRNIAGVALLGFSIVGMALVASIIAFNRPRFLSPPHMRAQLGALVEWRIERRNR